MPTFEEIATKELTAQSERLIFAGAKEVDISVSVHKPSYGNEIVVSFSCGEYPGATKGNNLHDVVTEYIRRMGWNEANKPMTLIGSSKANDDGSEVQQTEHTRVRNARTDLADDIPF